LKSDEITKTDLQKLLKNNWNIIPIIIFRAMGVIFGIANAELNKYNISNTIITLNRKYKRR